MKNVEDVYPLSPLQQGMLFHSLLTPDAGTYINQCSCRLDGDLDPEAFRQTWQGVVDRHAILRSAFFWEGLDEPMQAVRQQVTVPWEELDWRGVPPAEREERLQAMRVEHRHTPFPLAKAPLMRLTIVRVEENAWEFIWTFHHLLLDGWSTPMLLQEVFATFGALRAGRRPDLPPALPFSGYIGWLQRQDLGAAESFWRRSLAGFTAPTQIGIDRQRPGARPGEDYGEENAAVGAEITAALQAFTARHMLTLNTLAAGAWTLLLSRYGGEEDVVFGTVVSGRPADLPGVEATLGLFTNTLPFRAQAPANQKVLPWLLELQARQVELRQFEYSPLAQVQKWSSLPPGTPLFESLFVFENYPLLPGGGGPVGGGLGPIQVSVVRSVDRTNYPLALALSTAGGELLLRATYDKGRFEPAAMRRMLEHFRRLLAEMVAAPDRRLGDVPMLGDEELRQLAAWNDTRRPYDLDRCLHGLIAEQAERTPTTEAVRFAGEALTYRELDLRAGRLARRLADLGCGPEARVGVLMERSLEMVVSLLGILKAGAAYVPLDPEHPQERLAFQAEDARVSLVLAQEHLAGRLPETAARVLPLALRDLDAGEPWVETRTEPDHPAYVIYTSGSTGRPKGVAVSHRAIVNRLLWMQEAYLLTPEDRVLQKTPFSFDVSVWEFFWPLLAGARLVVAKPGGHRDNAYLAKLIEREGITVMHFVPSMLQLFLDEPAAAHSCRSLRDVMASGEALPAETAERFLELFGARLHNLYGPTEAAVDVTAWACERGASSRTIRTVPIGRPIANTRIHLLDRELRPVAIGVPGELYISGVGGVNLARGYVHRPDLTAERFLPDPVSGEAGARLYRTGDLARHREGGAREGGAIEFLGRTDHQVKVRGFRIELGEIEAALAGLPGVRAAVVAAREREDGHRRLVAYVVPAAGNGAAPATEELRDALARVLPEYMIPAQFVVLPELPLNASGKVDRKALPEPTMARPELDAAFAPPEGPIETALADVWAEALGVEGVGRNDNFFSLGGDSMLSLRILSGAREKGIELALQQIFQHRTIRELALALESGAGGEVETEEAAPFDLVGAEHREKLPPDVEDAYPLALLQAGMLFHSELDPDTAVYHDVFSAHIEAPFDAEALRRAAASAVARHPVLRTSFDLSSFSEPLQLVHAAAEPEFEIVDLRALDAAGHEAALDRWIEEEKRRPFVWSRPPLLRIRVHRIGDAAFQLILGFHHAILDGWSVATLAAELVQTYLAFHWGQQLREPAPPSSFHTFVALERRTLASEESGRFWESVLAGAEATMVPRWPNASARRGGAALEHPLSAPTSAKVQALAQELGVPVKSVLLAAHAQVLAHLSGRDDVVTGLVANGRPEDGGEWALGLFLNTVPLRLGTAAASWRDLARRAFEAERDLLPHRRFPLAELQRRAGGRPLFEAAFNYVHFHVYEQMAQAGTGVRVLGGRFFEQTNFTFFANFSLSEGVLHLRLEYDAGEFPAVQIASIAALYECTLAAIAAAPEARPGETLLLAEAERHQVLQEWNDTWAADPEPLALHQLIEAQARRTPNAPAVTFEGETLPYAELDRRAARLARRLAALGCGPETVVGIALERSLELMVALLGTLKAGAAYLPLDLDYPQERLAFMLADARPAAVLTLQAHRATLPAADVPTLCLDDPDESAGEAEPLPLAGDLQLAYTIYTSGSTGKPKGSLLHHRGIRNRLLWMQRAYELTAADTVLQKTPLGFDVSVWELFWPLLAGARLVLAQPGGHRDPAYLAELIARERVTVLHFVPSLLQAFLAEPGAASASSLRLVVASGEALPPSLERRFFERLPGARLENLYGPTEASVDVTSWTCSPGEHRSVPIGRPIANVRCHVVDSALRPAPVGAPGELLLGGVNVGRCYLGRPELTAERFVPDPFAAEPGGRLYRTGDLARHLPGGEIEFLGRLDTQVKLRGVRIELGEIESALAEHPAVREAAVALRPGPGGDPWLVAYLTFNRTDPSDPSDLQAFLKNRLPEAMVPAVFMTLEAFPLSPNGKLDRRALPAPEPASRERAQEYVAPRTPAEANLARIWEDVLRLDRVGIHDNLFTIGGHSLLATQIVARIRETFQITLPLRALYQAPTVAELAVAVVQRQAEQTDAALLERLLADVESLGASELKALLESPSAVQGEPVP
jgi:amino acid adenylation domain-containing protein